MNFLSFLKDKGKGFEDMHVPTTNELFLDALKMTSGASRTRDTKYEIFNHIIAFRGVCDGLGTSLLVSNTALALADYGLRVCVVDTSILKPVQDVYLDTNIKDMDRKNIVDWFDMPFSDKNVLNTSKISKAISALSFTNRTILDILSVADTEELVITAFKQLSERFDVVLVDVCNEPSAVSATAMQKSHIVYQVWGNDRQSLNSIDSFVRNCGIIACTADKLRYVITSNTIDDIPTNWESVLKRYNFKHLAHVGMSLDIARVNAMGKPLWQLASKSEAVEEFNTCIASICTKILGLELKTKDRGSVTTLDILNGDVNGTLAKTEKDAFIKDAPLRNRVSSDTATAIKDMDSVRSTESTEDQEVTSINSDEVVENEQEGREGILSFLGFGKKDRR